MSEVAFLDTTVFADRMFGRAEVRNRIRRKLDGRRVLSSGYVREQFRSTFVRAAVLLHATLLETGDAIETWRRTDEYEFFKTGEGVKSRKILAALLSRQDTDVDDKLETLSRWITHDMMANWDRWCSKVDDTKCCRCDDEPRRAATGVFSFTHSCNLKSPRPCSIEDFWSQRPKMMSDLSQSEISPDIVRTAATEVQNGQPPRGRRCHVNLSDAVIAAEAPPGSLIVTSNLKDFVPLAQVLGGGRWSSNYDG